MVGSPIIHVLDIIGFEDRGLLLNGFDQLCINYWNEKVQNFFAHESLTTAISGMEGESESIKACLSAHTSLPWTSMLDRCVELFETKRTGVLAVLNQHSRLRTLQGERALAIKLFAANHDARWYIPQPSVRNEALLVAAKDWRHLFVVRDSFGDVTYNGADFAEKNSQRISRGCAAIMGSSKNTVLCAMGAAERKSAAAQLQSERFTQEHGTRGVQTAATVVQSNAATLLDVFKAPEKHFLVCVKPTETLQQGGGVVDSDFVLRQIRLHHIVDLVTTARSVHSYRMTSREFIGRYTHIGGSDRSLVSLVESLLAISVLDTEQCVVGSATVYLTSRQVGELENRRSLHMNACAMMLQQNLVAAVRRARYSPLVPEMRALHRAMTSSPSGDDTNDLTGHLAAYIRIIGPSAAREIRVLVEVKRMVSLGELGKRTTDSIADPATMADAP